jgi:uncharacterized protein (DUF983 family)
MGQVFMRLPQLILRSLRLRCPACGRGKIFRGLFAMSESCPHCGLRLERESGFYLGAIYFNYGLTALVVAIAYPVLTFVGHVPRNYALILCFVFVFLFPVFFHRYARSLWLGFDQFVDPQRRS